MDTTVAHVSVPGNLSSNDVLAVFHAVADGVADALGTVIDWGESGVRAGQYHADVSADARTVWKAAVSARQRRDQMRAYLAPGDGLRQWSEARDALLAWPRTAWSRLRRH